MERDMILRDKILDMINGYISNEKIHLDGSGYEIKIKDWIFDQYIQIIIDPDFELIIMDRFNDNGFPRENDLEDLLIDYSLFDDDMIIGILRKYFDKYKSWILDPIDILDPEDDISDMEDLGISNIRSKDGFMEIELNNGYFIFLNENDYYLYDDFESDEKIDKDIIRENFLILSGSIIDQMDKLSYDDFLDLEIEKMIDIDGINPEIINQYIHIILEGLNQKS